MLKTILTLIQQGENILIVGKTDSGKTYFIEHELLPYLQDFLSVIYFQDCNAITHSSTDVVIVDECEILFDKTFLEKRHPEESPYYSEKYLQKVNSWHQSLNLIQQPIICVVTRNDPIEIDYIVENYKVLEWNKQPVHVFSFPFGKESELL